MYGCIYDRMVHAGIATKHPEKVFCNRGGQIVDKEEAFGLATEYVLTHPHMIVYANETGLNTNQKMDGHNGGELFAVGVNQQEIGALGLTVDNHFTVLVFTADTGKPIMVAVILKLEQPRSKIPATWHLGLDYLKIKGCNGCNLDDLELLQENKEAMCGGSTCTFCGKEIPCHINVSPNASISSEMLAEMLSDMNGAEIFDQLTDGPKPFLLLDGHHNRMELPFLQYIHDNAHPWVVCISVPYGTHLWQVADSSELNGAF
jgi:hypothetical protein